MVHTDKSCSSVILVQIILVQVYLVQIQCTSNSSTNKYRKPRKCKTCCHWRRLLMLSCLSPDPSNNVSPSYKAKNRRSAPFYRKTKKHKEPVIKRGSLTLASVSVARSQKHNASLILQQIDTKNRWPVHVWFLSASVFSRASCCLACCEVLRWDWLSKLRHMVNTHNRSAGFWHISWWKVWLQHHTSHW